MVTFSHTTRLRPEENSLADNGLLPRPPTTDKGTGHRSSRVLPFPFSDATGAVVVSLSGHATLNRTRMVGACDDHASSTLL